MTHLKNIEKRKNSEFEEIFIQDNVWNDDNFGYRGFCKIWISRTNATHANTNLTKTK